MRRRAGWLRALLVAWPMALSAPALAQIVPDEQTAPPRLDAPPVVGGGAAARPESAPGAPTGAGDAPARTQPAVRATRVAEPPVPLTLRAAVDRALSANAELALAAREVDALEGAVIQAGLRPNPELAVFAEETRSRRRRAGNVQIDQRIELGGKRAARVDAAQRDRQAAVADLEVARAQLRATVIGAFFEVLTAQERMRLADASLELARRAVQAAAARSAAGAGSPVEPSRARVFEASTRIERVQAASSLAAARRQLSSLWGNPLPRFAQAEGELDALLTLPALAELAGRFDRAPGLVRAQLEVQRWQALVALERSRRIPDLIVSAGASQDEESGRNDPVVGVSIPIPIFDRNQGALLEATRRAARAEDALLAARIRLESGIALAHERFAATRTELEVLRGEILPGAQAALDAVNVGYLSGEFSFLDLLDAQRTLFDARVQYVQALASVQQSAAELERALAADLLGLAGAEP